MWGATLEGLRAQKRRAFQLHRLVEQQLQRLGHAVETMLRKERQQVVKSGRGLRLAPFGLKSAILVVVMGHA